MPNNKTLKDIFQAEGFLFPKTEEEVEKFEKLNPKLTEKLANWDESTQIIKRGRQKLSKINLPIDKNLESNIEEFRMVARKGNKISEGILKKMRNNQKKK